MSEERVKYFEAIEYPTLEDVKWAAYNNTKGDTPVNFERGTARYQWKVTYKPDNV